MFSPQSVLWNRPYGPVAHGFGHAWTEGEFFIVKIKIPKEAADNFRAIEGRLKVDVIADHLAD